ncbi:hypothetical protein WMY93_019975 [Mugilogobius chulae]|uniref:C2H2-type domain-containing protein n=1 Tax=Mugilogobius chulae TaxID=88201 RepID=A0AAW0NKP1_9GOBI
MDFFETPYDENVEIDYIHCEICNKSIRGETLYKLHLTNPGHLKNEETLVAEGKITRQQIVPEFDDILQYLEYLKIDEPIIGLDYLVEVPGQSSDFTGLKYNCTLCKVYAFLTEAVQHVIGRKHRQKYLEKNRPDLVNWDPQKNHTLPGKLIRAKAEIAERQGGTGKPKLLPKKSKSFLSFSAEGRPKNGKSTSYVQDLGVPSSKYESYPESSGRQWSEKSGLVQDRFEGTVADRAPLYATAEELQAAQDTLSNEYGPTDPKFPSLRSEIRERTPQKTDPHKGHKQTEPYQREPLAERSESAGDVFEMLKNIEIENEEEANFLKERLCSVLREFKARKSEKALQTAQSRTVIVKEYNNMRPVPEPQVQDNYGRLPRKKLDIRTEDFYADPRQEQREELSEDYQHHILPEAKYQSRNPEKETHRWPSNQPHAPVFDKPAPFPNRYQEPTRPQDYQLTDRFSDYRPPTSDLPMERGPRMSRPPQYSRNLDKITSTLLELVARK